MNFTHSDHIWEHFPTLSCCAIRISGITSTAQVIELIQLHMQHTRDRMSGITESELPEIQAWRRAFTLMGMKPTQYRCAAESLLRRFRKEDDLPRIHPLIDLCNSISLQFATPIAVFDLAEISGGLTVQPAHGDELYLSFSQESEHPESGEIIFVDDANNAHARRWTHRQSAASAIRATTSSALIVCEALHQTASEDVHTLLRVLLDDLTQVFQQPEAHAVLSTTNRLFEFQ